MSEKNIPLRRENIFFNAQTFKKLAAEANQEAMTVQGAVNKTAFLLAVLVVSAAGGWLAVALDGGSAGWWLWMAFAVLAALVVALFTCARRDAAGITAPLYAFLEGSVLGGLSAVFQAMYPGLVVQAVLLTFATLFGLLCIYRLSHFQVSAKFRLGVITGTLAILLVYAFDLILYLFGVPGLHFPHQTGLLGIASSIFIVIIAALNLVLDFDLIESGAREGAPQYMEWYCAFGLMVTLVWLYLEILELLIRIYASSDDN